MRDAAGMEVFIRVVEKSSFSAAAVELNLTPSAVSKQVSRLESELGVRLINRSTHEFNLTEAGKEVDQARDAVQEANATLSGTLKLHVTTRHRPIDDPSTSQPFSLRSSRPVSRFAG